MENYSLDLRWVEYKRSHLNCPIRSRFTATRMHRITQGSRLMAHCVALAKASGIGTISCCHGEEIGLGISLLHCVTAHFTLAHMPWSYQGVCLIASRVGAGGEKRRPTRRAKSAFCRQI